MADKIPQIIAALTGCIGGFALGTVIGWSSPATKLLEKPQNNNKAYSKSQTSWISSIMTLGAAFSVIPLPITMDTIGRKYTMMIIGACLTGSWLLLAFANSFALYVLGRFLCGFFSGSFCVVSPVYTAEVVESSIRGALGSCFQLFIVLGIFFTFCLGLTKNLMLIGIICSIFPIIMIIILFFLPDTPTFLIAADKGDDRIDDAFAFLRGGTCDYTDEKEQLMKEIADSQARKTEGVLVKFQQPACIKAFLICMLLMAAQQLSGINVVMFYAESIFAMSGSSITPNIASVILGFGQLFGTLLAVFTVDRCGRKILLYLSFFIMAVCLGCLGFYMYQQSHDKDSVKSLGVLPVIVVTLYILGFSIGAGPLPWAILGEMFAPEVKSVAGSICAFFNWFLAFIITKSFNDVVNVLHDFGAMWLYATFCVISLVLIKFFVLETKNKSLQEIQDSLEG